MKDTGNDDLFKPLSAKTGRKEYSAGGREKEGRGRMGDGNRVRMMLLRRKGNPQRARKGGA